VSYVDVSGSVPDVESGHVVVPADDAVVDVDGAVHPFHLERKSNSQNSMPCQQFNQLTFPRYLTYLPMGLTFTVVVNSGGTGGGGSLLFLPNYFEGSWGFQKI
jgi:hypothetical protein